MSAAADDSMHGYGARTLVAAESASFLQVAFHEPTTQKVKLVNTEYILTHGTEAHYVLL